MEEVIFLFMYHQLDDVTQRNFDRMGKFHPRAPLIPLAYQYEGQQSLSGTVDVALEQDYGWPILNVVPMEPDKLFMRWFLGSKRLQARRYVICEYDLFVNAAAETFYGSAWQADVAAARVVVPQDAPQWPWWKQAPWLDEAYPLRVGLSPLAASLWSHEALTRMARQPRFLRCHGELRMGTLARLVGLEPKEISGAKVTIGWRPEQNPSEGAAATWFHPVKHLAEAGPV